MRAAPKDLAKLAEQLRKFLNEAGWSQRHQARELTFFYPPPSLGIQGEYPLAIPENISRSGVEDILYGTANSLVEIYGYANLNDLLNTAASLSDLSHPARFITRFIDNTTKRGTIPLTSLASYTSNIEVALYRSAKFKYGEDTKEAELAAKNFAKDCLFLQTEQGSFVAKVEIPHTVLRQGDLFDIDPLVSTEICSSFFSAIHFLNKKIVKDDSPFESPEILGDALSLFDVELLESLTNIFLRTEMESLEFSLEVGTQVQTSSTGYLSNDRKDRISGFLKFIREQLRGESKLDISGSIVELRSRDPAGDKNFIKVVSIFHGDQTYASATLSNEQYQLALDAHRNKRQVRLKGNGIRLKTQIRLTKVIEFIV